jgi:BirA family transcriptional regulator, biotin operon repressor / biotin---[acetyl-CoA-carboxylase] ligase
MDLRLVRHASVDSTSARAFAAIDAGEARHGDLHVADCQEQGRGRLGRTWESPDGEGMYASLVLLPSPPGPRPAELTMAAGLGVLETIRELGLSRAELKWPNDIMVVGSKISGILAESRDLTGAQPALVVGIGINVRQTSFPESLTRERRVISLLRLGIDVSVDEVLAGLCRRLPRRISQALARTGEIAEDYLAATGLADSKVRARTGKEEVFGRLEELSLSHGLALRMEGGERRILPLEHVTALEPAGECDDDFSADSPSRRG